jgi:hypothetical protein
MADLSIPPAGTTIGKLTILRYGLPGSQRERIVFCRCDCGKLTRPLALSRIKRGSVRSCGCLPRVPKKDIIGHKFGRLTVMSDNERKTNRKVWFLCDCGNGVRTYIGSARNGTVVSCGCYKRERQLESHFKHGHSKTNSAEYRCWQNMKNRCRNPTAGCYDSYGGRGIRVCDRWQNSFQSFLADMGKKPSNEHSIERLDVNGNYEPSNCCWATRSEQARNTRRAIAIRLLKEARSMMDV